MLWYTKVYRVHTNIIYGRFDNIRTRQRFNSFLFLTKIRVHLKYIRSGQTYLRNFCKHIYFSRTSRYDCTCKKTNYTFVWLDRLHEFESQFSDSEPKRNKVAISFTTLCIMYMITIPTISVFVRRSIYVLRN